MTTDTIQLGTRKTTRLREALEAMQEVAEEFGASDLALRAREAWEPLDRGEIWVVVVGQFKRGKSTLLNALLGSRVLPTGMIPVTSVVTQIRWGPQPAVTAEFQGGTFETAGLHQLQEFVSEKGNPGNRKAVKKVEVTLPSSLLKGGLVLVDTPGIGSLDSGATDRAYAFLPRVDAALVVLSPDPPLGEAEGAYLRALLRHTPRLLFVLNKVDLFPEEAWKEAVEFNREGLARIQGSPVEDVEVIPASASRGMEGSEEGIEEIRLRLLNLASREGEVVAREAAFRRILGIARELGARLSVEERAIQLSDAGLEERLHRLEGLRKELASRREEVQPVLMDATRRLVKSTTHSLRERASNSTAVLAGALAHRIEREVGRGNGALVGAVSDELQAGVARIFDGWWTENEEMVKGRLNVAMARAAESVNATGSTLTDWVQQELGVALSPPPPPLDLIESRDFYYHVQGVKPELTVDLLWLLLPRSVFRWWIRRKVHRISAEDLELNVGRIRGDLLYRAQETMRGFFSELNRRALEAEEGIQTALMRALGARDTAQAEGADELDRLARGRERLKEVLAEAGDPGSNEVLVSVEAGGSSPEEGTE